MAGDPVAAVAEEERAPQLTTEYLGRPFTKHAQSILCKSEFLILKQTYIFRYILLHNHVYIHIFLHHFAYYICEHTVYTCITYIDRIVVFEGYCIYSNIPVVASSTPERFR